MPDIDLYTWTQPDGTVYHFRDDRSGPGGNILDLVYPIGSIYMSVNSVSPTTFIGGEWERIEDMFLLAAGASYSAGTTGGDNEHVHTTGGHTLTVNELPSHQHESLNSRAFVSTDRSHTPSRRAQAAGTGADNTLYSDVGLVRQNATEFTGGGKAHSHGDTGKASNLPPYLAVYVWKRTA